MIHHLPLRPHSVQRGRYAVTVESESGRALVAHAITTAMRDQGVTAAGLAAATGIPLTTLRDRLAGRSPFLLAELERIGEVLGSRPSTWFD